jgi:hypothetical protein
VRDEGFWSLVGSVAGAIECWLQSSVKDVVSDCAPAVGHQDGEFAWRCNALVTHLVRWRRPMAWERAVEPVSKVIAWT